MATCWSSHVSFAPHVCLQDMYVSICVGADSVTPSRSLQAAGCKAADGQLTMEEEAGESEGEEGKVGQSDREEGEGQDMEEGELPAHQGMPVQPGAAPHPIGHLGQAEMAPPPLVKIPPLGSLETRHQAGCLLEQQMPAWVLELFQYSQASWPHLEFLDHFQVHQTLQPKFRPVPDHTVWQADRLKPRTAVQQEFLVSPP